MQLLFNKTGPKLLFLIDGLGALLSALLLLLIAFHEPIFGMPAELLYRLWPLPLLFSIYSLSCYFFDPQNKRLFLLIIATANFSYCGLTLFLVCQNFEKLTTIGILYFLCEKIVILILATLEIKMAIRK